jgi:pimeloyl-ACP methyl ester carboxylesterase
MKLLLLTVSLPLIFSCKPRTQSETQSEKISTVSEADSAKRFRQFFLAAAKDKVGGNPEQLNQLIYLPTPLVVPNAQPSAEKFFNEVRQQLSAITPSDYFQNGRSAGTDSPNGDALNHSLRNLAKQFSEPLTIVIVPGVFGEFIQPRAFEEVFARSDVNFGKLWSAAATQNIFDLSGGKPTSLAKLISAGSMVDPNDPSQDLARVILFNTPKLSFESLRRIEDASQVFSRRLNMVFKLIGIPKNIVLVGYSRGTPVALDMLSIAQKQNSAWLPNVRAMISLAGVTYGSDLADSVEQPQHLNFKLFAQLKNLISKLDSDTQRWSKASMRPKILLANTTAYLDFVRGASSAAIAESFNADWSTARLLTELKSLSDKIAAQSRVSAGPSFELVHLLLTHYGLLSPDLFGDAYPKNVAAFKESLKSVMEAIDGLKTSSRLKWWRENTIPVNGIRYLSIAATMSDDSVLANSAFTTNPGSADDLMLKGSYLDFNSLSPVRINDSQVAVDKVRFWPQIAQSLNPKQQPYESSFLGVLGTHHWGLALPFANPQKDGSINPFPRLALLKAISAYVADDMGFQINSK